MLLPPTPCFRRRHDADAIADAIDITLVTATAPFFADAALLLLIIRCLLF